MSTDPIGGRWILGRPLGEGGSGKVFEAVDVTTGETAALKLLPPLDPEGLARFHREVGALALLRIPGVARLIADGLHGDQPYLVMERVNGAPFPGALPSPDWRWVGPRTARLIEIVGRIHAAGVIHRDLKPSNVLVDAAGAVTVLDFGLARGSSLGPTITGNGLRMGTPRYLAPEQLLGHRVDARADLYAIGVMVHEALLGRAPFPDEDWRSAAPRRLVAGTPPIGRHLPDLPWAAQRLVDRLLARDPAARPRSAGDALGILADDGASEVARLPWIGPRAPVDHLVREARAGRPVDLWGPPGSGRSRCVAEAVELLEAEGRTIRRARHGERPVESLRHFLDAEVAGTKGLGPFEKALRARLAAGDVVVLDVNDGIDAWSLSLVAHTRTAGAVIRVVDSPEAVHLGPVPGADIHPLFHGPDRVLHLREDAVALLVRRTDGLAGRMADELRRWVDQGHVRWEDGLLRLDPGDLDRLRTEPPADGSGDAPSLEGHLADLVAWVHLLAPACTVEALAKAAGLSPWEIEVEVEELERRGAVRRLSDRRVEPVGAGPSRPSAWDDHSLRSARRVAADAIPPGRPGRLGHLLASGDLPAAAAEALVVAAQAADVPGDGVRALDTVLDTPVEGAALLQVLEARADLAFQIRDRGTLRRLAEVAQARVGGDHPLSRLFAAAAASSADRRADLANLRTVPPQASLTLEAWRRLLIGHAAIRARDPGAEADIAEARALPGGAPHADNLLGLLRYQQHQFAAAGALHEAAAAAAAPGDRAAWLGNAAAAWLAALAPTQARDCARLAARIAAQRRMPLLECRAEALLGEADHQEGRARAVDTELVAIATQLGDPLVEAQVRGLAAGVAWQVGDRRLPALAQAATQAYARIGLGPAEVLFGALAAAAGVPTDLVDLAARITRTSFPRTRLQAWALIRPVAPGLVPSLDLAALLADIPPEARHLSLEVLSADEALRRLGWVARAHPRRASAHPLDEAAALFTLFTVTTTRDALVRAARDLLLEGGLRAVSLRAVGRRAGFSATAAYRHFGNKEDLVWEVVREGHEVFGRHLARGLRGRDARERLLGTAAGYLDFALEHRPWYLVMFVAPPEHLGFGSFAARTADEAAGTFRMLVDRVREGMDTGLLLPGDPESVSLAIWAHVHGLVTLYYRAPTAPTDPTCTPLPAVAAPPFASPEVFRRFYDASVAVLLRGYSVAP